MRGTRDCLDVSCRGGCRSSTPQQQHLFSNCRAQGLTACSPCAHVPRPSCQIWRFMDSSTCTDLFAEAGLFAGPSRLETRYWEPKTCLTKSQMLRSASRFSSAISIYISLSLSLFPSSIGYVAPKGAAGANPQPAQVHCQSASPRGSGYTPVHV